ncbi:hypothetical protein LG3211_4005 [Lysobacter gummosus]|nr:hypothetical protein LG3211_4005 [Lysobacter gummosus]
MGTHGSSDRWICESWGMQQADGPGRGGWPGRIASPAGGRDRTF